MNSFEATVLALEDLDGIGLCRAADHAASHCRDRTGNRAFQECC